MQRTALYDTHQRLGARLVDFGGWEMPLLYRGIREEHQHTRTVSSLFDVSHMGRIELSGKDAESLLDRVCTRNIARLKVGRSGYSHVCNERGGVLDDVIISRYEDHLLMVCNAGNREKILAHLNAHASGCNVRIEDNTTSTVMFAIQGPETFPLVESRGDSLPIRVADLGRYGFATGRFMGLSYSVFRSGYTGEEGLELILPAKAGTMVWDYLTRPGDGDRPTILPAGLGARDSLRLEAGMCLYGHELNEDVDPISAGCGWCVDLEKDFLGVEVLRKIQSDGLRRRLIGLVLEGRRIARQGSQVFHGDNEVGVVTSGTLSPTLNKSIAMAYVDAEHAEANASLSVDLRGTRSGATTVGLPFYKRK
ncbi:MAG: glycine cleavage system aminomethyltransferase GcvT [Phycisphaerae bacterium]